jgi:outer membrane protein OmpU
MVRLAGASFLAAVALSTSFAQADDLERLQLRINGQANLVGAYVDQTNQDGLDDLVFAVDTSLLGSAILPLDGGGEIGGRIAFDFDYASNFDSMLNDAGSTNVLGELWLYGEGRFGRVQVGLMDGAADIFGLGVPQVSRSIRADNPEVFLLGYPCDALCSSDPQAPGSLFSPNGMQLRSDLLGSDEYLKIMYSTPVMNGFRFGVSFAPDGTRDPGQLFGDDEINEQGNIWDFAASYLTTFGDVDLGLSAGYVTGENVNPTFARGDLEEWGGAVRLGYAEWTVGAAYRSTNIAGAGPVVRGVFGNVFEDETTDVWSFGLTYERGPWMFGANYITADEELAFWSEDQEGSGLQFAGAYTINENIRLSAGWQRFEFEGPFDVCFTDTGQFGCDTLDGDIGYLETSFNF